MRTDFLHRLPLKYYKMMTYVFRELQKIKLRTTQISLKMIISDNKIVKIRAGTSVLSVC